MRYYLRSKIHRATVTQSELNYEGSITIDKELMKMASLHKYEQVHVWNITNGSRLITYVIEGKKNTGVIGINGAGAHLCKPGDKIIIASFEQSDYPKPIILLIDDESGFKNTIKKRIVESVAGDYD